MEWELFAQTWIPVFVILGVITIGLLKYSKIRSKYQIAKMNGVKKIEKEKETFAGSINNIIDSAPKQLEQIESEIRTIRAECVKKGMTAEQMKPILARLESEKDMLSLASKYGGIIKPIAKPIGTIFEKFIGGIGQ